MYELFVNWIRRDRETGEETKVTAKYVTDKIMGRYNDVNIAMIGASKESPLTTGFADYWPDPKEVK